MKRKFMVFIATLIFVFAACKKSDNPGPGVKKYSSDLANDWMQLHIKLTRTTTGYNSVVSDRSIAYAGITLYESLQPGLPGYKSLLSQIGGTSIAIDKNRDQYYWPASVNAAMAKLTKSFFESTSAANLVTIDSLESAYNSKFQTEADPVIIQNAVNYGRQLATAIFTWSSTDGGHEAYKHLTDPTFTPKVGEGLWVPTAPGQAPVHPHWGDNRSFVSNIATVTQPGAPMAYSTEPKSPFYQMVDELYTISLSLSREDSVTAKFWGDQPGNLNVPAHATNILTQLIVYQKDGSYRGGNCLCAAWRSNE